MLKWLRDVLEDVRLELKISRALREVSKPKVTVPRKVFFCQAFEICGIECCGYCEEHLEECNKPHERIGRRP